MAARSARMFTELLKCSSRRRGMLGWTTKYFSPLLQYSSRLSSSTLKANKPVVTKYVNTLIQVRSFADTSDADEPSIEVQTMDVLKLFDKVDPSKVFRNI